MSGSQIYNPLMENILLVRVYNYLYFQILICSAMILMEETLKEMEWKIHWSYIK